MARDTFCTCVFRSGAERGAARARACVCVCEDLIRFLPFRARALKNQVSCTRIPDLPVVFFAGCRFGGGGGGDVRIDFARSGGGANRRRRWTVSVAEHWAAFEARDGAKEEDDDEEVPQDGDGPGGGGGGPGQADGQAR